jgi:hypothetical protein
VLTRHDRRRRWWGLFFVLGATWLTVAGFTFLEAHLRGWLFIGYWLATAGLAVLALLAGLLDWWIVRLRSRAARRTADADDEEPDAGGPAA